MPALRKLMQENCEFEASLGKTASKSIGRTPEENMFLTDHHSTTCLLGKD
jgi:hypothetical protein